MNNDFEALDAYGMLEENTLMGHLNMIRKALANGMNPHSRIVISRIDVNGVSIYSEEYRLNVDTKQQIVFLECDD